MKPEESELFGQLLVEFEKWSIADLYSVKRDMATRQFTTTEQDAWERALLDEIGRRTWSARSLSEVVYGRVILEGQFPGVTKKTGTN